MGLTELRTVASSPPCKNALRKALGLRVYAVLACVSFLLGLVPASAIAQQQTAGLEDRPRSLPDRPLAETTVTEGSATVAGTVLDVSGASVAGAEVSLMHEEEQNCTRWHPGRMANLILRRFLPVPTS